MPKIKPDNFSRSSPWLHGAGKQTFSEALPFSHPSGRSLLDTVFAPARTTCSDPHVFPNLGSLAPLFADPQIKKSSIFHSAECDLIYRQRDFRFSFANLFAPMVVVRVLGYDAVKLIKLLEQKFNVQVDP